MGLKASSPLMLQNIIGSGSATTFIIVVTSLVSLTAIGGYFYIRKRKEN